MSSKENAPEGWSTLISELEDAQQHLVQLISEMNSDPEYDYASWQEVQQDFSDYKASLEP